MTPFGSDAEIYYDGTDLVIDPDVAGSGDLKVNGGANFSITDNDSTAWKVAHGSNEYLLVNTTNSSEIVAIGNTSTNPTINILGSGTANFGGPVSFNKGTQNFLFTDNGAKLALQGQTSAADTALSMFSKDGDAELEVIRLPGSTYFILIPFDRDWETVYR